MASSPVLVTLSESEAGQAAGPPAEEEAVLVIRVVRPGPVITEVAAFLIIPAGQVTSPQAGH